jgi:predicted DNA-binding protein (MmcQ/YjbR family)
VTVDDYNAFCSSLPHAQHVVQWGGAHVWKVAGKVFAIAGWNDADEDLFVTFKCSDLSYDLLKEKPGLRPAPYLASRGMKWLQRTGQQSMNDRALRDYLAESHRIVSLGLPKRLQKELGLNKVGKLARRPVRSAKSAKVRSSRAASGDTP